jgi:hypothetical protein
MISRAGHHSSIPGCTDHMFIGGVLVLRKGGGGICCDVRWGEKGGWSWEW